MDRGAWQATVHRVRKSLTQLTNTYIHHVEDRQVVGTCYKLLGAQLSSL